MAEKIKYIVKCTFCDKDYTVEIEDGEDFSCPTCGGAGSREHASRVKESTEDAEVEKLKAELRKQKLKEWYGKRRSVSTIAKDEEKFDDFKFDRIDDYEASMQRSEPNKTGHEQEKDKEKEIHYFSENAIKGIFIALYIILLLCMWLIKKDEEKDDKQSYRYGYQYDLEDDKCMTYFLGFNGDGKRRIL